MIFTLEMVVGPLAVIVYEPQGYYIHIIITNMYIYECCNSEIQPLLQDAMTF